MTDEKRDILIRWKKRSDTYKLVLTSRAPKAKAKAGYKFKSWNRSLTVNASSDITITATYEAMVKVQKLDNANTNAPEGYVKAVFDPTSNGKLAGSKALIAINPSPIMKFRVKRNILTWMSLILLSSWQMASMAC